MSSKLIPKKIRQTLSVESGLNDGLVLPPLLLVLSLAQESGQASSPWQWILFSTFQIVFGIAVGMAVGYVGGKLFDITKQKGWLSESYEKITTLALALVAYSLAVLVGGNGFISAFSAGIALNICASESCKSFITFAENEGRLFTLIVFLIFGALMLPIGLYHLNINVLIYSLLSLTVIRLLPVMVSLIGKRLGMPTLVFLGWFGPRGLASILFGLLVVERSDLAAKQDILDVVIITVFLSVILHGLTAFPASKWLASISARRVKTY